MTYRIELRPAAVCALKKLDPPISRRIQGADDVLLIVVVALGHRRDVYDR